MPLVKLMSLLLYVVILFNCSLKLSTSLQSLAVCNRVHCGTHSGCNWQCQCRTQPEAASALALAVARRRRRRALALQALAVPLCQCQCTWNCQCPQIASADPSRRKNVRLSHTANRCRSKKLVLFLCAKFKCFHHP